MDKKKKIELVVELFELIAKGNNLEIKKVVTGRTRPDSYRIKVEMKNGDSNEEFKIYNKKYKFKHQKNFLFI